MRTNRVGFNTGKFDFLKVFLSNYHALYYKVSRYKIKIFFPFFYGIQFYGYLFPWKTAIIFSSRFSFLFFLFASIQPSQWSQWLIESIRTLLSNIENLIILTAAFYSEGVGSSSGLTGSNSSLNTNGLTPYQSISKPSSASSRSSNRSRSKTNLFSPTSSASTSTSSSSSSNNSTKPTTTDPTNNKNSTNSTSSLLTTNGNHIYKHRNTISNTADLKKTLQNIELKMRIVSSPNIRIADLFKCFLKNVPKSTETIEVSSS